MKTTSPSRPPRSPGSPRTPLAAWTALGIVLAWVLGAAPQAAAHVNSGANCASCHSGSRSGLTVTGSLTTTNLGAGALKLFKVAPGETTSIGIQVTDGHSQYGLALVNLDGGGVQNSANHLAYQADTSWTKRTGYYSVGPSSSNKSWTFRLGVLATTPPDFYLLRLRMAGTGGGRWAQEERFYLQVLKPTPTAPLIADPTWTGGVFACRVPTTAGYTYFLETRPDPTTGTWTVVSQAVGDGSVRSLVDSDASVPNRLYRVRVE